MMPIASVVKKKRPVVSTSVMLWTKTLINCKKSSIDFFDSETDKTNSLFFM